MKVDLLAMNRTELCKLLGVSMPTLRAAVDAGAPGVSASGGRGKSSEINGPQFVQWWIERERIKKNDAGTKPDADAQRRQVDLEIRQEELARVRRELVPRVAFAETLRDALTRLRVTIDRWPSRHAKDFVHVPDEIAAMQALQRLSADARATIRDTPMIWDAIGGD